MIQRNIRIMLIAVIGNVVAVYSFNIGLARMLSPETYGDYKVAESFFNLASIGVLMGGGPAAMRFLPGLIKLHDGKAVWGYVRFYLAVIVFASILVAVFTLSTTYILFKPASIAEIHPLVYAITVVPVAAFAALFGSVLQSAQRMEFAFLPWWIGFPVLTLIFTTLYFATVGSISAQFAVMIALLATSIILFYQFFKVKQLGLLMISHDVPQVNPSQWMKVSVPMMLLVALQAALNQVDIYMIEIMGKEADVGHFAVASTITLIIFATQLAVMGVFEPLMANAFKEGEKSVRALNARSFRRLVLFSVPVFALNMLFPGLILSVFFGKYSGSTEALRLLAPGYLISAVLASSYAWLQYAGYERKAAMAMLLGVVW